MKKFKNITKIIFCIILFAIIIVIAKTSIDILFTKIKDNKLRKENQSYIEDYLARNVRDEIVSIEPEIYIPGLLDGGHYEPTLEDNPSKRFRVTYTCYDSIMQLEYNIVFSHEEHQKIDFVENEKDELIKNYDKYNLNYELIESIIHKSGGLSTNLGNYNKYNLGEYILLIYSPDIKTTKEIEDNIHREVCKPAGKEDKTTQFVRVRIPRYIICNDKQLYIDMRNNKIKLSEYLKGKSYTLWNNEKSDLEIYISEVVNIMLGDRINDFKTTENTSEINELEKYVTDDKTWIVTYELDIDENYYLNTYILK